MGKYTQVPPAIPMSIQTVVDFLFSGFLVILGWLAKELWDMVKALKTDIISIKEDMPRSFVLKEDYRADIKDIKYMLTKIFDKFDSKADKY